MSKQEIYFLDTVNATRNYDPIIAAVDANSYHAFNVSFPFRYPLKNLKSIALKSVEMPLALPTIRLHNQCNKIVITFSYSTYSNISITVNVPANTYTNTSLISTINTQMNPKLTPYPGISISFTTVSAPFGSVCSITNNCTSLAIDNTPLTNLILGYGFTWSSTDSSSLQGSGPINVNAIDTCVNMVITNIPMMNSNNINPYTFKLQVNTLTNGILFLNDAAEHQKIFFNDNAFVLDRLNIVVYDRLGYPLTGYHNWTMTLLIDYYDTKEQEFLNLEY